MDGAEPSGEAPAPFMAMSADSLRQLFDRAPGFMAVSRGPEHRFEMMNAAYLQLVGHRDLIGKTVQETFPELAATGFVKLLDKVYASAKPFVGRGTPIQLQRTPGGPTEVRMLDFVFQPITGPDGRSTGLFVEGHDVTEQHQAIVALRESEERFRLIADSAPVPIWVTKLDRKRSFVNRAYLDFLGITYEQAVDFDWRTVIHPDDVERVVRESVAGEATLKPFVLEGRYRRGDGQWRWLRSESQPRWGPAGEHQGFIGVAHDITDSREAEATLRELNEVLERKVAERTADLSAALGRIQAEVNERQRAEEALRQAQKMEAVGQLTGGIAHDFNNLLTPIIGGLELIAARADEPRMKRMADTALESARRGAKLASQLLAFSRIQRISIEPVAVNAVVSNMAELIRHAVGSGVSVEIDLAPEAGSACCDSNQLENALLNLAINARDAMPGGGTLRIQTGKIRIAPGATELAPGDYVRIRVEDDGHGMAPEVLARATEPFFTTKPLGKGTGLGLAQVYGIARQSGGTLRIDSEPEGGTRVDVLLPAAAAEAAGEEQGSSTGDKWMQNKSASAATVLIIDDDAAVRSFLADSLEAIGYEVVTAEDGKQGLAALKAATPDLLLLDYAMPEMNGAEVARAVRTTHPVLPILFVTGYADTGQIEAAMGPDFPVLRKPFTIGQLAEAVDRQIRSN